MLKLESKEIYRELVSEQNSLLYNLDADQLSKVVGVSLARQYLIILCVRQTNEEAFSQVQRLVRERLKENI